MQDEDVWTQYGCFQRCSHMEQLSKSLWGSKISDKVQNLNSWVDTVFMYLLYLFLSYSIHFSLNIVILIYLFVSESEFGNKNSFTKKSNHSKENNLLQAKKVFGFVRHNSTIHIMFSTLLPTISEKQWKTLGYQDGVKFFLPLCDLMGHPILNVKLWSKITLKHKNQQHTYAIL